MSERLGSSRWRKSSVFSPITPRMRSSFQPGKLSAKLLAVVLTLLFRPENIVANLKSMEDGWTVERAMIAFVS